MMDVRGRNGVIGSGMMIPRRVRSAESFHRRSIHQQNSVERAFLFRLFQTIAKVEIFDCGKKDALIFEPNDTVF
jgi:hypothetical protein